MNTEPKRTISFSPPDMSELEINEVADCLRSGWITTGPRTKKLEKELKEYVGADGLVCLNSATASEELSLRILGIGEGDEVIVPAYTYTSSAAAAIHVGATVKFVDCAGYVNGRGVLEMDYSKVADAITEKTKAIIPVDLGGVPCDYDRIFEIVEEKKNLFNPKSNYTTDLDKLGARIQEKIGRVVIVADGAHALGAEWKGRKVGSIADFTSFSFHAVKNFTTAEGGAASWRHIDGIDDEEIYHWFQLLSLHGQSKDALAKTKLGAWEYDIVAPLYKCNMTDIMAAIGLKQLERYPGLLTRRKEIIGKYDAVCDELGVDHIVHFTDSYTSSGHLYITRITGCGDEERRTIITRMAEKGVATNVHYKPLPMMTAYKALGNDIKDFPNAYRLFENEITLPLHTKLSDEDVDFVIDVFRETVKDVRGY